MRERGGPHRLAARRGRAGSGWKSGPQEPRVDTAPRTGRNTGERRAQPRVGGGCPSRGAGGEMGLASGL